jgi:3',5'-cyclic AMP phosphodiesterase CpdA
MRFSGLRTTLRMAFMPLPAGLLLACGGSPASLPPDDDDPPAGEVLVGAGDIASCDSDGDEETAQLLDGIEGTVFTAGDNAYQEGTAQQFEECYGPSWGRYLSRTRPAPGNHDYLSPDAAPYYEYFGGRAGPAGRGYYSYRLGSWQILSLNSNVAAGPQSDQMAWLEAELSTHTGSCSLAYWHHPLFSSGDNGPTERMREIWALLDAAGVELIVTGHDHNYERFAPQDAEGNASAQGIRQIVVGTGGQGLRPFKTVAVNSLVRDASRFGVLKLTLATEAYSWQFVTVDGITDSGSDICT